MYPRPPGPPVFPGSFPPNCGPPRRPYPSSYIPGMGVAPGPPVGLPPFLNRWTPRPMSSPPLGQIPGSVPPLHMPPPSMRPATWAEPLPSPRHGSRRHSMHAPPASRPHPNRSSTFVETSGYKTEGEGRHQKKSRECHGQVNSKKTKEKERAEQIKAERRRLRGLSGLSTQNASLKKAKEKSRDESTTVHITINPENNNVRRDEPDKDHTSPQNVRSKSRGRSPPDEERPRRTTTRRPLSPPHNPPPTMPPRVPEPPTPPQTPRGEMRSPRVSRVSSVERDSPVDSPRSPTEPESRDPLKRFIDLFIEASRNLQYEDTTTGLRSGGAVPSSAGYDRRGRKKRPVYKFPRRRRLRGISVMRSDRESDNVWRDEDGEDDISRGKSLSSKEKLRSQYALGEMERHAQDAMHHQRNTRSKATSKSSKSRFSSMSGLRGQREGEGDLNLILRGFLTQLSRAMRTTDDWDEESILDDTRSGEFVVAILPARSSLLKGIPQYTPYHIPRLR